MPTIDRRTRADRARATIVNADIAMMSIDGRAAAAAFLERERVPFRVIVRDACEYRRKRRFSNRHEYSGDFR